MIITTTRMPSCSVNYKRDKALVPQGRGEGHPQPRPLVPGCGTHRRTATGRPLRERALVLKAGEHFPTALRRPLRASAASFRELAEQARPTPHCPARSRPDRRPRERDRSGPHEPHPDGHARAIQRRADRVALASEAGVPRTRSPTPQEPP